VTTVPPSGLASDGTAAADMVLLRISPPAAPEPATDLLRRCSPTAPGFPAPGLSDAARHYLLVDVAAEDPHRALAAALVVAEGRPGRSRLVAIAVDPALRRRGLATRLLCDIRLSLHAEGRVLELCTDADPSVTKMLRRLGFAEDTELANDDYAAGPVGRPVRWLSRDN